MVRLSREVSGSLTRIGIWRSDSENLAALWSISPSVAMRMVWLSAAVDGQIGARRDNQFGPVEIGLDPRRDQRIEPLHLFDQLRRGLL